MLALEPGTQVQTSTKAGWPHLHEKTVMDRLEELRGDANLISQGALGLCGEAAFYHHVIQRAPDQFFPMARALFRDGICRLGDLKINPREKLRDSKYKEIVEGHVPAGPDAASIPPQADWMLLTALRDSSNFWSRDYKGWPGGNAEASTLGEQARWRRQCGLYKRGGVRKYETDEQVELDRKAEIGFIVAFLKEMNNNVYQHVTLGIKMAMIRENADEGHAISLKSLEADVSADWVKFDYWSWGKLESNKVLTIHKFVSNVRGMIFAPYDP